jgi:hypothetical protein
MHRTLCTTLVFTYSRGDGNFAGLDRPDFNLSEPRMLLPA